MGTVVVRGSDDFYYLISGHEGDAKEFVASRSRGRSVFVDVSANASERLGDDA